MTPRWQAVETIVEAKYLHRCARCGETNISNSQSPFLLGWVHVERRSEGITSFRYLCPQCGNVLYKIIDAPSGAVPA